MKRKIVVILAMCLVFLFSIKTGIASPKKTGMVSSNQILTSMGIKYNTYEGEGESRANLANGFQYVHFIKPNLGLGLDISYAPLNNRENISEARAHAISALINLRYYWISGKIRLYSKVGGGTLFGVISKSGVVELNDQNNINAINGLQNKYQDKVSEKSKLKLGLTAGAFVGADWSFFKGLGVNIETGISYDNLHDAMFTNGKYSSFSFLSRVGISYKF